MGDRVQEFGENAAAGIRLGLGLQLRCWRKRVEKGAVAELSPARRRSAGSLTQADVAWLAGVTEGWYRALESGGERPFSDGFLMSVARALRLDREETFALFVGAVGRRPPTADHDRRVDRLEELKGVAHLLGLYEPCPAYLVDHKYDVLAINDTMADWFPWAGRPSANVLRWVLTSRESRSQFADWPAAARTYLGILRYLLAVNPADAHICRLLADVLATDEECRRLWASTFEIIEHCDHCRFLLRLPGRAGEVVGLSTVVMQPALLPGHQVVVMVPDAMAAAQAA
ncbi:MAG: helix-turn-helix domain-containing protein [Catenulispora sp.]|nr:helix-turn-helix domain-containing protein [Catenulispora sp.]